MSEQQFLTPEGAAKLKAELEALTTVKRVELSARLRDAIKMGDLSENADYIMAKEDQAFLEGRIQELQRLLSNAQIVTGEMDKSVIAVGSQVEVQEVGDSGTETYFLVGAREADPRQGRISNESPIGRALMGRRAGEVVQAQTPGGALKLKILKIH